MKNNARRSKYDPLVKEVMLLESNPQYALIRRQDGNASTVSIRQLGPPEDIYKIRLSEAAENIETPSITQSSEIP